MVTVAMTQYLASGAATLRVDPLNVLLGLAAITAIVGGCYSLWRAMSRRGRTSDQFYRDFYGDTRPGVPQIPGVRVMLVELSDKMDQIVTEITPNHGGSMKDAVGRIDTRMGTLEADVKGLHDRLDGGKEVQVNVHT